MFQFFVEPEQISNEEVQIMGSDVNHIKNVLRMKIGEHVRVSDNQGANFLCEIIKINNEQVILKILEECEGTELPVKVTLFQALPKRDKMEWVIQKAVELGVYEIIPVVMKNCVVKLDAKKAETKRVRWQAIAESAAKQCKRSLIPQIGEVRDFSKAVTYARSMDIPLFPYEQARGMAYTREVLHGIKKGASIGIFIGPEGGFSSEEIEMVQDDMALISLGNRILRTETAGMVALAMLIYEMEN